MGNKNAHVIDCSKCFKATQRNSIFEARLEFISSNTSIIVHKSKDIPLLSSDKVNFNIGILVHSNAHLV